MKKYIIIAVLLLLVGWVVYSNVNQNKDVTNSEVDATVGTKKGDTAPDFTLKTSDGKTVKLSDYRGQKVILNFWATWCPPCREEIPDMVKFYENYKDKGIVILGVNLTTAERSPGGVPQFLKDYNISYPVLMDEKGDVGDRQYNVNAIPTTYILDSNGKITEVITGPMTYTSMETVTKNIP